MDEVFMLYTGTCSSLTEINPPGCVDYPPTSTLSETPGTTVYVRVWEYFDDSTGVFDICAYQPCNPPTSITAQATPAGPITSPTNITFDVTSHSGGICPGGQWEYQWETSTGTVLQAWSTTSSYTETVNSTGTYVVFMRCSACSTHTSSDNVTIYYVNPMTNDECSTAVSLTVDSICHYQTYMLDGATSSVNNTPSCGSYDNSTDVWFSFTVPASGIFNVDVEGETGMDEVFMLYTGTCSSLTEINPPGCVDYPPSGIISATPGSTVYIRVWEYFDDPTGLFDICVTEPPPMITAGQDCISGYTVCSDQQFTGNSNGYGTQELDTTNRGCLVSNEHQSSWYLFSPNTPGIIELAITPQNYTDDYDFAIWGPFPPGSTAADICPPTTAPIRCSYSAADGTTGLIDSVDVTDNSENSLGDKWVNEIVVGSSDVGSVYVMCIDNYSQTTVPFTLDWTLTGVNLDCTILPVILLNADAKCEDDGVSIHWTTASENNNDRFIISRLDDRGEFIDIGFVQGAGNSNHKVSYNYLDKVQAEGNVVYQLSQVDFDGIRTELTTMNVECYHISGFNIESASLDANFGHLIINFCGSAGEEYIIQLMDISGNVVFNDKFIASADGKNQSKSYFNKVSDGIYVVSLTNSKGITKYCKVSPR